MSNCRLACSHVHLPGWSQLRINNHSYYFVVKNHNTKHIKEWLNLRLLIRGPISYKNTLKILCGVCIHNLSSLSFLVPVQNSRIITINGKPFVSFLNMTLKEHSQPSLRPSGLHNWIIFWCTISRFNVNIVCLHCFCKTQMP